MYHTNPFEPKFEEGERVKVRHFSSCKYGRSYQSGRKGEVLECSWDMLNQCFYYKVLFKKPREISCLFAEIDLEKC